MTIRPMSHRYLCTVDLRKDRMSDLQVHWGKRQAEEEEGEEVRMMCRPTYHLDQRTADRHMDRPLGRRERLDTRRAVA